MFDEDEIIDINSASQEEWELLPGIGRNKAQTVIEYRTSIGGKFSAIEDLKNAPGISAALFETLIPRLRCRITSTRRNNAPEISVCTRMSLRSTPSPSTQPPVLLKSKRKSTTKLSRNELSFPDKRPRLSSTSEAKNENSVKVGSVNRLKFTLPSCASPSESVRRRLPSSRTSGPPAALNNWLEDFQSWNNEERTTALNSLVELCDMSLVRHLMAKIEPLFQRDFISLLPKELALYVLSFLEPRDLCRAAQTCRYWRILAEDNLYVSCLLLILTYFCSISFQ